MSCCLILFCYVLFFGGKEAWAFELLASPSKLRSGQEGIESIALFYNESRFLFEIWSLFWPSALMFFLLDENILITELATLLILLGLIPLVLTGTFDNYALDALTLLVLV